MAEWTADLFGDSQKIVVESIRHPAEIKFLKDTYGATIIAVTATRFNRFNYMDKRKREGDPTSYKEFSARDEREFTPSYPHSIDISGCVNLSDVRIQNNRSLSNFETGIQITLRRLGIEGNKSSVERGR